MRKVLHLFPLISIFLYCSPYSHGQSWSNILSSSRAINWSNAGLPATLPDGEITPNPWTPPARTQCVTPACNAVSSGTVTFASVNAALASAPSGSYVLLPSGTFTLTGTGGCSSANSANITLYAQSSVSLRGSGPQSTVINLGTDGSTASICFGIVWSVGSSVISSGLSQGSTSVTVPSISGAGGLVAGELATITQCNTGLSGSGCGTGNQTDNGGLFVCGFSSTCSQQTSGSALNAQTQTVLITSVTGSGPYTVNFSPGLYLPNWSTNQNATLTWENSVNGSGIANPNSNGLEDLTINVNGNTSNSPIAFVNTYASWIKGVRILGIGASYSVNMLWDKNCLFVNNYIYAALGLGSNDNTMLGTGTTSDSLIINNILMGGVAWEGEGANSGNVLAYNASKFANRSYYQCTEFEHHGGSSFAMREGNQICKTNEDDTWGTGFLNTYFRNNWSGADPPFTISGSTTAFSNGIGAFRRFDNAIGNALGTSAYITNYQSTIASPQNTPAFEFNNGSPQDPLTQTSFMRWGNCDTATATCRFQSSEVPTSLSGNAAPFENTVPTSNSLPCSFFLPGYTSTTCTPHPSGGTGLNFWKVCAAWTSFPTSCSTYTLQPFPTTGPDVTGGPYVNGTSYDIPAMVAFNNLPIDANYQNSYSITGSNWSNGTETLTVSGLPSSTHIIGGFQVTGTSGCNNPAGGEFIMTSSSSMTVSYALASNPGSCSGGTMKFPDVRQFDERVFQTDSAATGSAPAAPTGVSASAQ